VLAGAPGLDAIVATLAEAVQWLLQQHPARAQGTATRWVTATIRCPAGVAASRKAGRPGGCGAGDA